MSSALATEKSNPLLHHFKSFQELKNSDSVGSLPPPIPGTQARDMLSHSSTPTNKL